MQNANCAVSLGNANTVACKRRIWELVRTDRMAETDRTDTCDEFHDVIHPEGFQLSHADLVKRSTANIVQEKKSNEIS